MDRALQRAQDPITFGRMLRNERKALGKSQRDVAAAIGIRRQTIAELENGKNVGQHVLFAMLGTLGKMVLITSADHPGLETMRAMMDDFDDD